VVEAALAYNSCRKANRRLPQDCIGPDQLPIRSIIKRLSRQEALSTLRAQQAVLHARFGVVRLALFGSVARDEAGQDSDVDLLVEFDRPVGLFRFMELQSYLEDLLRSGVDLGTPQSLKPRIRDRVLAEAVRVV
jgi:predicted nucleotidyltransferase